MTTPIDTPAQPDGREVALREAVAKATPGPWDIYRHQAPTPSDAIDELIFQVNETADFVGEVLMLNAGGKCPAITGCGPTSADNAAAIVALRNDAIPLLDAHIARADRAEAALRDLLDAARNACDARKHPPLTEALANGDAALGATP